jgi:hypothetical protein
MEIEGAVRCSQAPTLNPITRNMNSVHRILIYSFCEMHANVIVYLCLVLPYYRCPSEFANTISCIVFKYPVALIHSSQTILFPPKMQLIFPPPPFHCHNMFRPYTAIITCSTYTEQHHHHTGRVRCIQAGGIHDNYINISRATYTQTPMPLHK